MDKLGLEICGLVFVGIFAISAFTLIDASNWREARFIAGINFDDFPKEVMSIQDHTPTNNCTMTYYYFSSSEIYLQQVNCDKLPSYQEWKYLLRYNELVGAELTKDFSEYISNQLLSTGEKA